MRHHLTFCIIVALAMLLQGCGKKGPLELPQSQPHASVSQPSQPGPSA